MEDDDKVLPFDLLRNTLFHPTRQDIHQTGDLCATLAEEAACVFRVEFRDTPKCTPRYLSAIKGKYSNAVLSEKDKEADMRKEATSSISKSGHAWSTSPHGDSRSRVGRTRSGPSIRPIFQSQVVRPTVRTD